MKEMLQNKLKENLKYRVPAILICITLAVGLFVTRDYSVSNYFTLTRRSIFDAFDYLRSVGKDIFCMCLFRFLIFALVIQFLLIKFLGRVKNSSKLCCFIFLQNLISIFFVILIFGIIFVLCGSSIEHTLKSFYSNNIHRYVAVDILHLVGTNWSIYSLFYSIAFAIPATVIATPLLYFFLRNDTTSKKLLLLSIFISCFICYTHFTLFFYI